MPQQPPRPPARPPARRRWFSFRKGDSDEISAAKIGAVAVLVAGVITGGAALGAALIQRPHDKPPGETASLVLTPKEVVNGGQYEARVSGLTAGETVRLTWSTKPSDPRNLINDVKADGSGVAVARITNQSEPGSYLVYAEGLKSGRIASSALRVVPGPPATLVGTATNSRSVTSAGITVRVTKVERYSDWLVVVHLTATNDHDQAVDLGAGNFSAVDDRGRQYGVYGDNPHTNWREHLSPGETVNGTIALNKSVDPAVRSLSITYRNIFIFGAGFRDLVVKNIRVPAG